MLTGVRLRLICPNCGENLEAGGETGYAQNEIDCPRCGTACGLTKPARSTARSEAVPAVKVVPTGNAAAMRHV